MTSGPRWLDRYLGGDRELVWHEMRQLGAGVRQAAFAEEARAVCDEVARRARRNIEVIIGRLTEQSYRFHSNDDAQTSEVPLAGPSEDSEHFVGWLEETFGPIPMILSSWIRIVGDVWLVGTHPRWEASAAADPLVVEIVGTRYPGYDRRRSLLEERNQWRAEPDGGPFFLAVAPDHLSKDNVSGGAYGIVLPDACADAYLVTDTGMSFVSYLRRGFETGGFPRSTGDSRQQWLVRQSLSAGLEEI